MGRDYRLRNIIYSRLSTRCAICQSAFYSREKKKTSSPIMPEMCIHPEERNLPILLLRFNRFSMCHNDFLNVSMLNSIKECIFAQLFLILLLYPIHDDFYSL